MEEVVEGEGEAEDEGAVVSVSTGEAASTCNRKGHEPISAATYQ